MEKELPYRELVELTDSCVLFVDIASPDDFRIRALNAVGERMTGLSTSSVAGVGFESVFPAAVAVKALEACRRCAASRSVEDRVIFLDFPSGTRIFAIKLIPILREGRVAMIGCIFRDITKEITERRRAEDQIRNLNADLKRRVDERAAELSKVNAELESFMYSVSHDLQEPLRTIDGFSRILIEEHASSLDEEGRRLLSIVRDSTRKMSALIEGLLALSRAGFGSLHRELVDMKLLAGETAHALLAGNEGRKIEFRSTDLPPAWADPLLIRQVFYNLLSNAFKYTRDRENALIEVGWIPGDDKAIYFVRDNGIGFNPAYSGKLFGVFQRLHADTRFEGTGCGLAIVKRIVEHHGGRVSGEGIPERGATFYFSLPLPAAKPST